jgi:hypothetical protein
MILSIIFLITLEFFWANSNWNFVQIVNKEYVKRDSLSQQILVYLIIAFFSLALTGFLRIKQIFKTYRI